MCQSALCQKATEVEQRFSLEEAITTQKKGFIIAKTFQINKGENLNILCLRAFNLAPKMGRVRQLALRSLSPGRKMVLSFKAKYVVPRQIKPRFPLFPLIDNK